MVIDVRPSIQHTDLPFSAAQTSPRTFRGLIKTKIHSNLASAVCKALSTSFLTVRKTVASSSAKEELSFPSSSTKR